jgi:hypothetical protein
MDDLEWYKYLVKTKVIVSIALVYVPIVFFTIYIDAFLSSQILGNYNLHDIHQLFSFPWWKILFDCLNSALCFMFSFWINRGAEKSHWQE